jgi:hypothetical protein
MMMMMEDRINIKIEIMRKASGVSCELALIECRSESDEETLYGREKEDIIASVRCELLRSTDPGWFESRRAQKKEMGYYDTRNSDCRDKTSTID